MDADHSDGDAYDEFTMETEVEVIDDPEVISSCCEFALSRRKLIVCCRCENSDAGVAAIVIFPIALKQGHPFCGSCFQHLSILHHA